ncbi:chemotaxis protein CheW [Desulfuromonas sp. CSMB_57]|uniref:chemotaxis protein CheW n=1 Tax=Desulfuromonas sp. CSMB_57 TaxID=2807629 RepID=UPI0020BDFF5A|nr:chemotaxis protein CheW [Desulfuromonas sp. CSMB_57]
MSPDAPPSTASGGPTDPVAPRRWLLVQGGDARYALDIEGIVAIMSTVALVPLPRVPEFIRGATVFRECVVPVLDVRQRLVPGSGDDGRGAKVVVCLWQQQMIGLRVAGVGPLVQADRQEQVSERESEDGVARFFDGYIPISRGAVPILSLAALCDFPLGAD